MDKELLNRCDMPEFIGVEVCDTIGIVIPAPDRELCAAMNIPPEYPAVGLIGSRTGAAAQIVAVDDAVKAANAKVISIELPRDTKGWGGHGNFIILGSESVSDVREAVRTALELIHKNCGEIFISEAGHMEFQYTARSGEAVNKAFGAPIGGAFGFVCASPAPIGFIISDIALKAAGVKLLKVLRPDDGTSHSNEVILTFTGEASAVKTAVIEAKAAGMKLLNAMGSPALPVTEPFIK